MFTVQFDFDGAAPPSTSRRGDKWAIVFLQHLITSPLNSLHLSPILRTTWYVREQQWVGIEWNRWLNEWNEIKFSIKWMWPWRWYSIWKSVEKWWPFVNKWDERVHCVEVSVGVHCCSISFVWQPYQQLMQHKKQQFALPSRENVENCVTSHHTVAHMQHTINT